MVPLLLRKGGGASSGLSPYSRLRSFRSDAALEAIARAAEQKVPNVVLYNYPSFSGAFSALFAHLFHTRLHLPCLVLPFSSVVPLRFHRFLLILRLFHQDLAVSNAALSDWLFNKVLNHSELNITWIMDAVVIIFSFKLLLLLFFYFTGLMIYMLKGLSDAIFLTSWVRRDLLPPFHGDPHVSKLILHCNLRSTLIKKKKIVFWR